MVLSAWVSETYKDGYPTASPGNKIPSNTVLGLKSNPRSWWKQTEICTIISTPSVQPPHQHFDPPVPFSVWVQEQLCSQQPKAEGWEPEVDYLSVSGLSPLSLCPTHVTASTTTAPHKRGRWVLEQCSKGWEGEQIPALVTTPCPQPYLLFHSSPWHLQHQRSKKTWIPLTTHVKGKLGCVNPAESSWPGGECCKRRYTLLPGLCYACRRVISLADTSAFPLPFCPLCIISNGPEQDFL